MKWAIAKRVRRLGIYFLILGVVSFLGYLYKGLGNFFLIFLGPALFLAAWLRRFGGPLVEMTPHEPLFNNYLLLLPVTLLYFGLVGWLLKNIINKERGAVRILMLALFLLFLLYVHSVAFRELGLYWHGSTPA
jgi:hypothetical protein